MRSLILLLANIVVWSGLVLLTITLVRAFDARRMPDLERWHRIELQSEFHASLARRMDFAGYRELENRLSAELQSRLIEPLANDERSDFNRYDPDARSHAPAELERWNRTVVLEPDVAPRGGMLLMHGLTDSPYSMRAIAELFRDQGFFVVVLRLPGMGTVPGAAARVHWRDWTAATELAAAYVAQRLAATGGPFYAGGYSNGGLLALEYALAANGRSVRPPDRLFLFSPAVGITRFAMFAGWHRLLSWIPYFEKVAWQSIRPEYDPFKYNSFPINAGRQGYLLSRAVERRLERLDQQQLRALPPMLTFQSLVDATVSTTAVLELYQVAGDARSQLVLFDTNRYAPLQRFLRNVPLPAAQHADGYDFTLLTNIDEQSLQLSAERRSVGQPAQHEPLSMRWPEGVYSLSHVAVPFRPDDPIYGAGSPADPGFTLGSVTLRGERDMLALPMETFTRLRHNPFFDYVARRCIEFCDICQSVRRSAEETQP